MLASNSKRKLVPVTGIPYMQLGSSPGDLLEQMRSWSVAAPALVAYALQRWLPSAIYRNDIDLFSGRVVLGQGAAR